MKLKPMLIVALSIFATTCLLVGYVVVVAVMGVSGLIGASQYCRPGISNAVAIETIGGNGSELGQAAVSYLKQFSQAQQTQQLANARTIVDVGTKLAAERTKALSPAQLQASGGSSGGAITEHDIEAAVGVAIQESNLLNNPLGDRDSLGLFQQRPSAGWGTRQQIMDPAYAAGQFYSHMLRNLPEASRSSMSLIQIGIGVQNPSVSAYYSRWQWDGVAKDLVSFYLKTGSGSSDLTANCGVSVNAGNWTLPLDPGYYVSDVFGMRYHPVYHVMIMHEGYDLADPKGAKIYAIHDGTVEKASPSGDYGNFILIDHGGGVESAYGHLSAYAVTAGEQVKAGQLIGYVGATGDATGPHLHFEIRVNKKAVDPAKYLQSQGIQLVPSK